MRLITKNKAAIIVNLIIISYLIYILASTPPAKGYEVSIYDAYPIIFWVLYFVLYLFNISYILIANNGKATLIGLAGVLASVLILALLPLQRDYFCIDGGDSLTHLTYIKNLVYEGKLGLFTTSTDPYPLPHLLTAGLVYAGLNIQDAIQVMPVFYYVWFAVFMYLLARHLIEDNQAVALLMLLVLLPILGMQYFYPSMFFIYLLPSLFYFLLKKWWIPVAAIMIILPFTHPASCVLLLMFALLLWIACIPEHHGISSLPNSRIALVIDRRHLILLVIFVVTLIAWVVTMRVQALPIAYMAIATAIKIPFYAAPHSQYSEIVKGIGQANMNIGELFLLYVKRYGQMHLVMCLGAAGSVSVIYLWIRRKFVEYKGMTALSMLCLLYCTLYLTSFFSSDYIVLGRVYPFALIISAFPAAVLLCNLIKRRRVRVWLIILPLLATNFFAVFTMYASPFNRASSQQITTSEINAVAWVLENKEPGEKVYDLLRKQGRMSNYILGYDYQESDKLEGLDAKGLPAHFGYEEYETLGDALGEDCYLITNTKNIEVSTKVYPEYEDAWRYHPDDYVKLGNDESLTLVFEEDGVRVYQVRGATSEN